MDQGSCKKVFFMPTHPCCIYRCCAYVSYCILNDYDKNLSVGFNESFHSLLPLLYSISLCRVATSVSSNAISSPTQWTAMSSRSWYRRSSLPVAAGQYMRNIHRLCRYGAHCHLACNVVSVKIPQPLLAEGYCDQCCLSVFFQTSYLPTSRDLL